MDLTRMLNDGGFLMYGLLLPAMLGVMALGVWQLLKARQGVPPKLHHGASITVLAAGLLVAVAALRLGFGVLASQGESGELIVDIVRVALQPLFLAAATVVALGVLQLVSILLAPRESTRQPVGGRLRLVASLASASLALAAMLAILWVILISTTTSPGIPENPRAFAEALYRLNTASAVAGALALVLGLATIWISLRARDAVVRRAADPHGAA